MFIGCSRCEIVSCPEIRPRYDRMALDCWYGEELRERERERQLADVMMGPCCFFNDCPRNHVVETASIHLAAAMYRP